jgi:peptide-methionine (S)-S-oxide reductase
VVQLGYDPQVIGLARLLDVFFAIHDPTSLNRQGHDVGTQYRSGIYVSHTDDLALVQAYIDDLRASQVFNQPIVTEVLPLTHYWPAEDYHQNYFVNHPNQGYCAFVVAPKVQKLTQSFRALLKD